MRSLSNEENQERIENLRGPFLAKVKEELAKIVKDGRMSEDEALILFADALDVDSGLTEKDARIYAWQTVASPAEIQKIQNGEA